MAVDIASIEITNCNIQSQFVQLLLVKGRTRREKIFRY